MESAALPLRHEVLADYDVSMGMLIMGETVHVLGQKVHGNSVSSTQFCCECKTGPKN